MSGISNATIEEFINEENDAFKKNVLVFFCLIISLVLQIFTELLRKTSLSAH